MSTDIQLPPGMKLKYTLEGHKGLIRGLAWSPDGQRIACTSGYNNYIKIWDTQQGSLVATSSHNVSSRGDLGWASSGQIITSFTSTGLVNFWNSATGELSQRKVGKNFKHNYDMYYAHLSSSPDGSKLALSDGSSFCIFNFSDHKESHNGQFSYIKDIAWSGDSKLLALVLPSTGFAILDLRSNNVEIINKRLPYTYNPTCASWSNDNNLIAFGCSDGTIRLFSLLENKFTRILEGHSASVDKLSWSSDGKLLASTSTEELIIQRCDTWQTCAKFERKHTYESTLTFHPTKPLLATSSLDRRYVCRIWKFDYNFLLPKVIGRVVEYTNAKVALVGDSGVGKSGLALVLTGQPYTKTDSTHGRHIWTFSNDIVPITEEREQQRETLLWDFAGQPGYRVHHQLHLSEVAVALVIFDASNDSDPFAGVIYWARALDEATKGFPLVKLLVAARTDRGTPFVSPQHIEDVCQKYGFSSYYETSALRGEGIRELIEGIYTAIAWDKILPISAPELFHDVKHFFGT